MKRYKISADDEKSRHAWIMAIKKVQYNVVFVNNVIHVWGALLTDCS